MEWMNDKRLANIDQNKLSFMGKLVFELHNLEEEKKLPFLLALAANAQKQKISFRSDEAKLMISVLKEYSSEEEVQKMDQMLKVFQERDAKK